MWDWMELPMRVKIYMDISLLSLSHAKVVTLGWLIGSKLFVKVFITIGLVPQSFLRQGPRYCVANDNTFLTLARKLAEW